MAVTQENAKVFDGPRKLGGVNRIINTANSLGVNITSVPGSKEKLSLVSIEGETRIFLNDNEAPGNCGPASRDIGASKRKIITKR
jgi:hypothetical protein